MKAIEQYVLSSGDVLQAVQNRSNFGGFCG